MSIKTKEDFYDKELNLFDLCRARNIFDKVMIKFKKLGLSFYGGNYNFKETYLYPFISYDPRTECLRSCKSTNRGNNQISIEQFLEE